MLVIPLNPGAALNQALQTVGKSRRSFAIPEMRFCARVLVLGAKVRATW